MSVRIIQDGPREFRVVSRWGSTTWPSLAQAANAAEELLMTIRLALDQLEQDTPAPDPEPAPAPAPEPEPVPAPVEPAPAPAPEAGEKPTTGTPAPAAAPQTAKAPRPTVHPRYEPCSYQGCGKVGYPMETHWGRGFRFCDEHADAARRVLEQPTRGHGAGPRFVEFGKEAS